MPINTDYSTKTKFAATKFEINNVEAFDPLASSESEFSFKSVKTVETRVRKKLPLCFDNSSCIHQ
jgi:hypothetical protein